MWKVEVKWSDEHGWEHCGPDSFDSWEKVVKWIEQEFPECDTPYRITFTPEDE